MADIFISYAKKDREKVEPIALALMEQGWSVFWDRAIPGGKTWDEVIEEELDAAKSVIVVWSKISIKSRWVRAEAEEGLHRNILVPVSIEDVKIPLLFRPIQSVRLIKWQQDSNHPQFVKLISDLSPILGPSPKKIKESKQLRAEEERKQKDAEAKRKAEEEQRRRVVKAEIKTDKPEPDATAPSKPRKTSNALKFGAVAGVIVLLMFGVLWYFSGFQTKKQSIAEQTDKSKPPVEKPKIKTPEPPSSQKVITNSIDMKFVLIPAGKFIMGSQLSPKSLLLDTEVMQDTITIVMSNHNIT